EVQCRQQPGRYVAFLQVLVEELGRYQLALREEFAITFLIKLTCSKQADEDEIAADDLVADGPERVRFIQARYEIQVVAFQATDLVFGTEPFQKVVADGDQGIGCTGKGG